MARPRRRILQGIGALLPNAYLPGFAAAALYQGPLKGVCSPLLNCYACPSALLSCPIGAVQHFAATGRVPFYALGTLALAGAAAGRMTCGFLCPFGALQDVLHKARVPKRSLPRWTRYLKYPVLAVAVFLVPYLTREPWFSKLCPAGTLMGGLPWMVMSPAVRSLAGPLFVLKIAILLAVLALAAAIKRPFCRAACPLGAILSLFNRTSLVRLAWNPATCTDCGECRKICPVDISPRRDPGDPDCIRCLDCTICPSLKATTVFHRRPFAAPRPEDGAAAPTGIGVR